MGGLLKLALVGAVGYGIWFFALRGGCGTKGALECPADRAIDEGVGIVLAREEVCPGSGYFCHELRNDFAVARWPLDTGKLRVRVALPGLGDDPAWERELQDAAVEGVMGWDRRPFPLVLDTGKRTPLTGWDINVNWYRGGGGHARVSLDVKGKRLKYAIDGLQVLVPPTGAMTRDQVLALVKATASHEMGHALGLMHSDSDRDIMYPRFTPGATPDQPSGRDYRTVEALYALPNGAAVR
jgi:hypothetical protein